MDRMDGMDCSPLGLSALCTLHLAPPTERRPLSTEHPSTPLSPLDRLLEHGERLRVLGRYKDAEAMARQAIGLDAEDGRGWLLLARTLNGLNRHKEAIVAAREAARVDSDDTWNVFMLACVLHDAGKYRESQKALDECLRRDPNDANHHWLQGLLHGRRGSTRKARESIRRALALNPWHQSALVSAAQLERSAGKTSEAEAMARRALRNNPEDADAHLQMGSVLSNKRRTDEALEHYRAALRKDPGNKVALQQIEQTQMLRGPIIRLVAEPKVLTWPGHDPLGEFLTLWLIVGKFIGLLSFSDMRGQFAWPSLRDNSLPFILLVLLGPVLAFCTVSSLRVLARALWAFWRHPPAGHRTLLFSAVGLILGGLALLVGGLAAGEARVWTLGAGLLAGGLVLRHAYWLERRWLRWALWLAAAATAWAWATDPALQGPHWPRLWSVPATLLAVLPWKSFHTWRTKERFG